MAVAIPIALITLMLFAFALRWLRKRCGGHSDANELEVDVPRIVLQAAHNLYERSNIPGVSETAKLVQMLAEMIERSENSNSVGDKLLPWCRYILSRLERMTDLLDKVGEVGEVGEVGAVGEVGEVAARPRDRKK